MIGKQTELSVVIVSYNVADLLEACLDSLGRARKEVDGLEVVVVDNNSSDDSVSRVQMKFPWVSVIKNSVNRGFATANNQGMQIARGRFLFLLNPDTVVKPRALRILLDAIGRDPSVGAAGPLITYPNGRIQETCARLLPTLSSELFFVGLSLHQVPLLGKSLLRRFLFPYDYRVQQYVEAILGAAFMIRRETLEEAGQLDERFFYCGEDIEWCARIQGCGRRLLFVPQAVIVHHSGKSSQQVVNQASVNAFVSIGHFYSKASGAIAGVLYRGIILSVALPKFLIVSVLKLLIGKIGWAGFRMRMSIVRGTLRWRYISS